MGNFPFNAGALVSTPGSPGGIGINTATNAGIAAVIDPGANNVKGLVVFAHSAGQTATLIEAENNSFTPVFTVDKAGNVLMSGLATLNGGTATAGSAPVLTPAFANGTAAQLSDTTRDYMVYLECTTAGTTLVVAIGPTSTPANSIITSSTATLGELVSFRLPAGWWVKWSATTAAFATQTAIGC